MADDVAAQGKCRLIEFGDLRGWDAEGIADDLRLDLICGKDDERIAYVGDKVLKRTLVDLSKPVPARRSDISIFPRWRAPLHS